MKWLAASTSCLLLGLALHGCSSPPKGAAESRPENVQAASPSPTDFQPPTPSPSPSPEDPKVVKRRKQIEKDMLAGSYHHDGSIELMEIGNIGSVPALLAVLKKNPPMKLGNGLSFICTTSHALSALRKITGQNAGNTFEEWDAWWAQYQKEKDVDPKRAA